MTDLLPTFKGEVMLLDWSETAKGGAKIVLQLDGPESLEPFRTMTLAKRGVAGQRLMAVMVEVGDDDRPAMPSVPKRDEHRPFGAEASRLYSCGFFFNPKVMEAVGTPEEYAAWVQRQPSAYSGKFSEYVNGEGRCVAAHVRRVADGAGAAIKNDYAVIPLTNEEHAMQHQRGESALGGKAWCDQQRARHLSRWMAETVFHEPSMGHVSPARVLVWATDHKLTAYLPEIYR